ncbi:hypothetical protein WJX77_004388 [Trebouxia sp. C0004]
MATYGGIEASEARLLPDTGNQLISFNLVALQSMMQAVAREVAERICVEGPTGIKLRECADKVIGLKQEMTVLKQNVKAQANTQDSLRAAVSALDKQVQVLPSTLAKQLAQPAEQQDSLPKSKSEATELLQKRQTQGSDVTEKQLAQWSEVLDEQPEAESVLAARAAFMHQQQQQQQSVPLSRQLIEEPQKQLASAIPNPVEPIPSQAEEQQAASPKAQAAGPTAAPEPVVPPITVVQFDSTALEGSISDVKVTTLELKAELGKSNQKLLALTQRLLAATTAEASTTAAEADAAVAPSQAEANVPLASSSGPGPSVNFAADTVSVQPPPASTPVADDASASAPLGAAATAAARPSPVPAGSKAEEQPSGEDKESDAAAVTAVIWKELAEMSAAQAKLKAAVGAGVEDVREVRQRLVAIEAGIVKSQRQEDKRGVDLLHRLSESEGKVSGLASELEAANQKTETKCNGIRKEVSKAMSEQRQQLIAQSEAMAKKMDGIAVKADRATQELPSLVGPISRGLNAAVERLSLLEHTALKPGDAIQPNDLDKILARAMEAPRAGISNVEQHVNQLEQRLEDCLVHKANSADVPSNTQMANQVRQAQNKAQAALQALQDQMQQHLAGKADKGGVQAGEAGLQQRCSQLETALLQGLQQVTDRAAAALSLKADGEEVSELRLYVKGQFADVRAVAKEGIGRGRLTHTTAAGHTLCLSCDQPLSPLRAHTHEPLAQQGVYPVPDEGVTDGWTPSAAPLSANEPIGAAINARHQAEKKRLQMAMAPADHVPPGRTSTPELAELSTNPSIVRASNPRLKQQTVSGSIAQGYLPSKQNIKGSGVPSGAARRPADTDPARRSSK